MKHTIALFLGLSLTVSLLWLLDSLAALPPARAGNLTVCREGPPNCNFADIQAAVDAATTGDLIQVASGVYTDINTYGGLRQIVYISKTVTIQGGYTTTNWTTPYPITQPTTLDARGQGRVLYITGDISPSIEGLHITNGNATGLGGSPWLEEIDAGSGLYISNAAAVIRHNYVFNNTAVPGSGGGIYLHSSNATLEGNLISNNGASRGGGIGTDSSAAMFLGNTIISNHGTGGGGLFLFESDAAFESNVINSNTADYNGGAAYLAYSDASLTNTVIADNQAIVGSGLFIWFSSPHLLHTTIARNGGGENSGIHVTTLSNAFLTNTLLVSQTVGITVTAGNTATLNGVLWFGNGTNIGGTGVTITTNDVTGDPRFAPDGYHLTAGSAAIDRGIDAGVTTDIDGQARPRGLAPDLGADEYVSTRYVAPTGVNAGDCANSTTPCRTVQYAVDVADEGNTVKVASGVYTDISARAGVTQVVYISKTVAIQGSYTTTNWTAPYPITQPATLDAQGQGRVLYITGNIHPTVEGLRITNGTPVGLGGGPSGEHAGGGIYATGASVALNRCTIFNNTSNTGSGIVGGGVYMQFVTATLGQNQVFSNAVPGVGGGIGIYSSTAVLDKNEVFGNSAGSNTGGGLVLANSVVTLTGNVIMSNTTSYGGGGVLVYESQAALIGNTLSQNAATSNVGNSGGVAVVRSESTFEKTIVTHNAANQGGGIGVFEGTVTLTNNVISDNHAGDSGAGIYIGGASAYLFHNTLARNSGSSGIEVARNGSVGGYAALTNTILVSHTIGIRVMSGNTATLNGVLWFGNGTNTGGTGFVTATNAITGDPVFNNPSAGDYHIGTLSAALDAGVPAGVNTDLDNDTRPTSPFSLDAPDLGADENKALTVIRPVSGTVTFGAALARIVFTDTGGLRLITITVAPGSFPTSQLNEQVVRRTIIITPNGVASPSAMLALQYTDSELGALNESDLKLYRWTQYGWQAHSTAGDAANNIVTATRVNGFSPWAIGAISLIPTAVQTQKFVAHIGVPAWLLAEIVILSLVTVATGTTVAMWVKRRKRN